MMNVTLHSNRFAYHARTQTFVAECSDLQIGRPDNITIVSTKTGVAVEFTYTGKLQEQEDYDGELMGWEYKSWAGYKIHLYND